MYVAQFINLNTKLISKIITAMRVHAMIRLRSTFEKVERKSIATTHPISFSINTRILMSLFWKTQPTVLWVSWSARMTESKFKLSPQEKRRMIRPYYRNLMSIWNKRSKFWHQANWIKTPLILQDFRTSKALMIRSSSYCCQMKTH